MQEEQTSLQDRLESLQRERDTLFPYTLDSDNDTVSDAKDRCPGTVRGAEVGTDGCERDRDRDGVVDRLDLCPESPENADTNRFGCAGGEPVVLSGIFFSGGNAELSPAAQSYLDTVAGVLELSADSRFEVAGHTDSIGEAARNLTVSRQRAEAVTDYLVKKGIAAGRLVPEGYGADQPVADNATAEGRAANRRVELKILPPGENSAPAGEKEPVTAAEEEGLPVR
jgi:outer membrane protein OmpA-like peptidoglycan-associated protein